MPDRKVIVIEGAEPGLPYSKGLRASELMVTGLPPYRSYQVAEQIEERLLERKVASVTSEELDDLTVEVLTDLAGERYAPSWLRGRGIKGLDVAVGIRALVERAAVEGTSVVIEGAHVVPGFFDLEAYQGRVLAVPVVITVDEEDLHRSHFAVRSADAGSRPFERYMRGFRNIRR